MFATKKEFSQTRPTASSDTTGAPNRAPPVRDLTVTAAAHPTQAQAQAQAQAQGCLIDRPIQRTTTSSSRTVKRSTTIQLRETLSEANLRALHQHRQLSVREVAAQLDVANKTIYSALDQHNIAIENYPIDHHKPHLKDLLTKQTLSDAINDERLTVAQIAARYDCSVQTIYTYLHTHRIDLPEQPPRTHKPDELTIENVRQLYHEQQLSIRDTAKRIGVSNKALRNFMDRHNMERRNYVRQLDTNKIVDAYQSGATLQDLADQYDCSLWAITKRLDDAGIARRIGKRPAA